MKWAFSANMPEDNQLSLFDDLFLKNKVKEFVSNQRIFSYIKVGGNEMIQEMAQTLLAKAVDFGASDNYLLPVKAGVSVVFRKSTHRDKYQLLSEADGQSLISHFSLQLG
jgi:type II secretory ATPase GspE/PulE/Tfp pilus assembly ATPase PilB-like protein